MTGGAGSRVVAGGGGGGDGSRKGGVDDDGGGGSNGGGGSEDNASVNGDVRAALWGRRVLCFEVPGTASRCPAGVRAGANLPPANCFEVPASICPPQTTPDGSRIGGFSFSVGTPRPDLRTTQRVNF